MLKIYNTLTRKKEPFIPLDGRKVRIYVCGMTTYSDAHIGHARTYVAFDIIRRYLEYKGYEVRYIQNITDIDDKIIKAANERGMDPLEYSDYYAKRALGDMAALGVREADYYPKASEHVKEMIELVSLLIKRGYAYEADGDVYFSVEKFEDYGKLSGQDVSQIKAGARIKPGEKKRKPEDFALWKAAKPGEPKWDSPWGKGRPGWHIECSVMSSLYLGIPFDIHGGGQDLIFPHHENEIAQAEAAYGKKFVNYWMHSGMLKVEGEKMSKSIGNIINVRDALEKWDSEAIRFFFASYHYRSPADFSEDALKNAENAVRRLRIAREKLERASEAAENEMAEGDEIDEKGQKFMQKIDEARRKFEDAMDDDFNTPRAIEALFDFVRESNRYLMEENVSRSVCRYALDIFMKMANVLTLLQQEEKKVDMELLHEMAERYGVEKGDAEEIINALVELRKRARQGKNYALADEIREKLREAGIELEDIGKETKWHVV